MKYLAALVLSVVVLSGCSDTEPVRESTTQAPTVEAPSPDEAFIAVLKDDPVLSDVPDSTLISLGHEVCGAFDRGASFEEVATVGMSEGFSPETTGTIIGASVGAYCTQHMDLIDNAAAGSVT